MITDLVVVGGGPAGTVVARLLARLGYRVTVISRPRRLPALEGISERTLSGLRFAGCRHALAGIGPELRRLAHWNGQRFAGNQEWLIERGSFDAALGEDSRAAGVILLIDKVNGLKPCGAHWQLKLASGKILTAAFLIEARGRAAPHRRDTLRRGPSTIALGRCWELPAAAPPGTRVASFAEGWAWFANHASAMGIVQLFVSAQSNPLPPRPELESYYHRLLSAIPEAREWLADARPTGSVFARYAHPQFDSQLLDKAYARVGDAAFAIDPLSGHGIYESIGGALALAATVNTLLAKPQDAEIAARFYRERIESDFLRMARIGRDFYRIEQRWPEHAFWRERRAWPDGEPAHARPDQGPAHIEQRPVNADGFIALQEVIVTPDHPRGVWQVAGIALVPLLRWLQNQQGDTLTAIARGYAERHGGKPTDCQTALAWLASRGLLRLA